MILLKKRKALKKGQQPEAEYLIIPQGKALPINNIQNTCPARQNHVAEVLQQVLVHIHQEAVQNRHQLLQAEVLEIRAPSVLQDLLVLLVLLVLRVALQAEEGDLEAQEDNLKKIIL